MEMRKSLKRIFKRHGMGKEYLRQEPLFLWEKVSGETIGGVTSPLQVKNHILYVQVPNHAMQHELNMLKEGYIERINERLGRDELKDIKFKVGYSNGSETDSSDKKLNLDEISLSYQETAELNEILDELEEGRLKETFLRLFAGFKKVEKAREKLGWARCERCGVYHKSDGSVCPACKLELG